MADFNAEDRLLLGTVGWERADWLDGYYPHDLPPDWRLAYYANDCSCVLLPADQWLGQANGETLLEGAPEHLSFFLEVPAAVRLADCQALSLFAPRAAVVLVVRPQPEFSALPQWVAEGPGVWVDGGSRAALVRWTVDRDDLRALRARAETLDADVRGLVLDGPGASPARVPELRTLLELMGRR